MECNFQGSPEAKKACKGILKSSSSFDKHTVSGSGRRKSTKFDELNVMATYHPPDKDYGHMKIEEPKTPFNYANTDENSVDQLDAEVLAVKLSTTTRRSLTDSSQDSDDESLEEESVEERMKRSEFEKRRRMHYNEGEALKLARKLIEEDEDEDDDANNLGGASSSSASNVNQCIGNATETAEIVTIPESSSIKPPTIEIDMESEKS